CNMRRASINKRLSASINIGIINLAATFSSCLSRVSHPDCRATRRAIAPAGDATAPRWSYASFDASAAELRIFLRRFPDGRTGHACAQQR
ncbi:hypothetical protein, partial [Paraburkholderia sp. NMBU_R16]|uniref:hypothetical protein n=1 Tax=Paraburkholderia sp. NMBU_R16 TaxID=2698676 RepID=UPI001C26AFC8